MSLSLAKRQLIYEDCYDYKITSGLPLAIRIQARNLKKIFDLEYGSFDAFLMECMGDASLFLATNVQSAVFVLQCYDEINLIIKNDNDSWYQNNVQKISSISASLVTLGFIKSLNKCRADLSNSGDVAFYSKAFALPSLAEVYNYLMYRQQKSIRSIIYDSCFYYISDVYGRHEAERLISGKTVEEKIDLLFEICDINFYNLYPTSFVRGTAAYKVPTLINNNNKELKKNKWTLDSDIPVFLDDKDFIYNILLNGYDVFRAKNLFNEK
jgi:tRNA(His) 5'-end guanylyltransferase